MAMIEYGPEQVEIDDQIKLGYRLGVTRDELSRQLSDSMLDEAGYEVLVRDYLNALTDFHFGPNSEPRFATMSDVDHMIHNEISLIAGSNSEAGPYIADKLTGYCQDERADWLRDNDLPVIPRAAIHTMIDLIDDNRPLPLVGAEKCAATAVSVY